MACVHTVTVLEKKWLNCQNNNGLENTDVPEDVTAIRWCSCISVKLYSCKCFFGRKHVEKLIGSNSLN